MTPLELMYKSINLNDFELTSHAVKDREDRIIEILSTTGFGKVVKVLPDRNNTYNIITNEQVSIICSNDLKRIITLYRLTQSKYYSLIAT